MKLLSKRLTILVLAFICYHSLIAQQYPLLSNNIDNLLFLNPASSGASDFLEIRGVYRTQWSAIEDAPTSQFIGFRDGADSSRLGYGISAYNDAAGRINHTGTNLNLSYNFKEDSSGVMGIGLGLGMNRWMLDESSVVTTETNDQAIINSSNQFKPNITFGFYLNRKNVLLSLGVRQLLNSDIAFSEKDEFETSSIDRHLNATVGYNLDLGKIEIQPIGHFRYFESAPFQWDAGLRLKLNPIWVGGFYRESKAISLQAGLNLGRNFSLYYAHDLVTSEIKSDAPASHEIGLAYIFGLGKDSDGDGIPDAEDDCPEEPGVADDNGCPKKDSDGDGIPDEKDDCPDIAGLEKYNGCPDTDGDGIIDSEDDCPEIPGKEVNSGCPDSDEDGVLDKDDDCPHLKGSISMRGCPDSDGDGLSDVVDNCPNVPGPKENAGCPWMDSDGDGITDNLDRCPTIPGPEDNGGCPVQQLANSDMDGDGVPDHLDRCPKTIGSGDNDGCPRLSDVQKETIYLALVNLEFEFDRAVIVQSSLPYLDRLAELMVQKYDWRLRIAGHTDNIGPDDYNMRLSRDRSYAVQNYLLSRGMLPSQFVVEYYGESRPIDTNDTEEGRQRNRRVEMEFVFD